MKRHRRIFIPALFLLTSILLVSFVIEPAQSDSVKNLYQSDLTVKTLDGLDVPLKNFGGKAAVITFFATWCMPCVAEVPTFNKIHSQFKDKGVRVACVSLDGLPADAIRKFAKEWNIEYELYLAGMEAPRKLGILLVPTTYLVRPNGEVVDTYTGLINENKLIEAVGALAR